MRLVKSDVSASAALVPPDDLFEAPKSPASIVLQGPHMVENAHRRSAARGDEIVDETAGTWIDTAPPRYYHLDFDVIITAPNEGDLLDLQERWALFLQLHPLLDFATYGYLPVDELVPVGGLNRVNLSNLRQASGRVRIVDCPIFASDTKSGKLIVTREFAFTGDAAGVYPIETASFTGDGRTPEATTPDEEDLPS